jgi:hypothetical protein
MSSKIENAKVTKFFLGIEDHGIFTYALTFEFDGTQQGTGHYCLGKDGHSVDVTGQVLRGLLAVFEVDEVSKITNKYCRIKRVDDTWSSPIFQVGNIVKNIWFDLTTSLLVAKEDVNKEIPTEETKQKETK